MKTIISIQNRIYEIRGERVMLDTDLAMLYNVETRVFNQSVKRNINRFPIDFMFRITEEEWRSVNEQRQNLKETMSSQIVMTYPTKRPKHALPYVFTEQGVAMLSGILNSEHAVNMNIAIMRAFVSIRRVLITEDDMREQIKQIKERVGEHDVQLSQIYDALENLIDEKANQKNWENRERIGFKKD